MSMATLIPAVVTSQPAAAATLTTTKHTPRLPPLALVASIIIVISLPLHVLIRVLKLDDTQELYDVNIYLLFMAHLALAVILQLCILHWERLESSQVCQVLQYPYILPPKPVDPHKYLDQFADSKYLQRVRSGSDEFDDVKRLVGDTWCYCNETRKGRDSHGLHHQRLVVKQVCRCLATNHSRAYDAVSTSISLPAELRDKPIMTTTCVRNDELHRGDRKVRLTHSGDHVIQIDTEPDSTTEADRLLTDNPTSQDTNVSTTELGEWRLFHGTSIQNVLPIVRRMFDLRKAEETAMYGRGIYLAESSEKADQYADIAGARRTDNLTMFVVCVKPGVVNCYPVSTSSSSQPTRETGTVLRSTGTEVLEQGKPTIVAGLDKRFREVIVHEERRCKPQYVVIYDRV